MLAAILRASRFLSVSVSRQMRIAVSCSAMRLRRETVPSKQVIDEIDASDYGGEAMKVIKAKAQKWCNRMVEEESE
jgi:hypothetical protein